MESVKQTRSSAICTSVYQIDDELTHSKKKRSLVFLNREIMNGLKTLARTETFNKKYFYFLYLKEKQQKKKEN